MVRRGLVFQLAADETLEPAERIFQAMDEVGGDSADGGRLGGQSQLLVRPPQAFGALRQQVVRLLDAAKGQRQCQHQNAASSDKGDGGLKGEVAIQLRVFTSDASTLDDELRHAQQVCFLFEMHRDLHDQQRHRGSVRLGQQIDIAQLPFRVKMTDWFEGAEARQLLRRQFRLGNVGRKGVVELPRGCEQTNPQHALQSRNPEHEIELLRRVIQRAQQLISGLVCGLLQERNRVQNLPVVIDDLLAGFFAQPGAGPSDCQAQDAQRQPDHQGRQPPRARTLWLNLRYLFHVLVPPLTDAVRGRKVTQARIKTSVLVIWATDRLKPALACPWHILNCRCRLASLQ